MKKYANVNTVRQSSANVEFVSDIRTGKVVYAAYGSDMDGYSPLVRGGLEAKDGGLLDLIVLWVLGFRFGWRDSLNDFCLRIVPLIKSEFKRIRSWFSTDDISNLQTDLWRCLSGLNRAKPFDIKKGSLSGYVHYRVLGYVTDQNRRKKLAKRLAGLSLIVDDDTPLSSIGDKGLLGLVFEPSDPDTKPSKWVKMSAKPAGVLESIVANENEVAIERILSRIDPIDREILELSFLEGTSCQAIRDSLENRGLVKMTMNGIRKRILRIVNGLRQKLQPGSPPVIGLKGRYGRVTIMEEIET